MQAAGDHDLLASVHNVVMLTEGPCAAGPSSAQAGDTMMQAADSAAASSHEALTPADEAYSSQQAAANPSFGGSMPWGGPSTATYAFDFDSSQPLEGIGSTGPSVDFDLDLDQSSQALGFSQSRGTARSAAAAVTSDRLQSDAQSQLQGPETGAEAWGHQQQELEGWVRQEHPEGDGDNLCLLQQCCHHDCWNKAMTGTSTSAPAGAARFQYLSALWACSNCTSTCCGVQARALVLQALAGRLPLYPNVALRHFGAQHLVLFDSSIWAVGFLLKCLMTGLLGARADNICCWL